MGNFSGLPQTPLDMHVLNGWELAMVEQAAQDNNQKSRGLQKELNTVSKEMMGLRDNVLSISTTKLELVTELDLQM